MNDQPFKDLQDKVALVTGASRGIGKDTAIALARAGCHVAVNYRKEEALARETAGQITALGRKAVLVQADVSKDAEVRAMVAQVREGLGNVQVLINNAGWARKQEMDDITEADWDEIFAVNLKSCWLVTRAVLPAMRAAGWGRIVNVSSGAAQFGGVVGIHYTAAKGGMDALTRAYAARLVKEGITVNTVAPVLIATSPDRITPERKALVPMGRLGTAEEVAEAIAFTAANAYMTGQIVHLNGGLYFR